MIPSSGYARLYSSMTAAIEASHAASQIKLDDLVSRTIRKTLEEISVTRFPVQGVSSTPEEVAKRIRAYESITTDIQAVSILLARWSSPSQLPLLEKVFARFVEAEKGTAGYNFLIGLGWHPTMLLTFSAGIAALSARKYDALNTIFMTRAGVEGRRKANEPVLEQWVDAITDISDVYKSLPGHDRNYVPRSEYLYKAAQPAIEDLLFVGASYENLFDRLEIFVALTYADIYSRKGGRTWGPPGRFAWKHSGRSRGDSPYDKFLEEAKLAGGQWEPLKHGFFQGSYPRFEEIALGYKAMLDNLNWW